MKRFATTTAVATTVLIFLLSFPSWADVSVPVESDSFADPPTATLAPYAADADLAPFAANGDTETVYFTPMDEETSTTVLCLHNTSNMAATVGLQTFTKTGDIFIDTTVDVPAHNVVRVCADPVVSNAPAWSNTVLANFMTFSTYAKMTLPPGVKADGYVVWNNALVYDPAMLAPTLSLQFWRDPDGTGTSDLNRSTRTLYFNPQDGDTSTTVLFLYNTGNTSRAVQIESFTRTGFPVLDTTIQVPAHGLVRACADLVLSLSSTWFFDVEFIDFGPSSASARMTLPPGVKAYGYVVWNDSGLYDPLMVAFTLGLRFSSEVDSAGGSAPGGSTPGGSLPTPTTGTVEDFEAGDFGPLPWLHSGAEHWFVTSSAAHTGSYCAQAGPITDNELSELKVCVSCAAGDIRFYVKVSSEWMYDCLKFKIDGDQVAEWSNEIDWTEVSFPVAAGIHAFAWRYFKDASHSVGEDTAWIDDIVFPTP